ncbi:hypothetical protein K443DRAFT_212027 [Laccaria amethystina LaAM-08-1]|uniref:Uncharacterized protein n=1 Tax=Laccaria amethystina LaAM-08-1 TaxID=1095629 RepID=A0A0C9XL31_9AGAR|nr:hypothetical protein K443DRAFT_212027 [Laccaria amethystina LaAM-08-1]
MGGCTFKSCPVWYSTRWSSSTAPCCPCPEVPFRLSVSSSTALCSAVTRISSCCTLLATEFFEDLPANAAASLSAREYRLSRSILLLSALGWLWVVPMARTEVWKRPRQKPTATRLITLLYIRQI